MPVDGVRPASLFFHHPPVITKFHRLLLSSSVASTGHGILVVFRRFTEGHKDFIGYGIRIWIQVEGGHGDAHCYSYIVFDKLNTAFSIDAIYVAFLVARYLCTLIDAAIHN